MDAIQHLRKRLSECFRPVPFETGEHDIRVMPADDSGFEVNLVRVGDEGECEVYFDAWHEVFDSEEEAVRYFLSGLSGECRIRVDSRGGFDHKWTLEAKHGDAWVAYSTTGTLFFPFWRKKEVRYLQNRHL